ncbi:MAG: cytochrome P450, partial [Chloroflexota bacterium]|nr:cytochrome P450 [Chloroflexota bacterium]
MTTVSIKQSTGNDRLPLPPAEGRFPLGVLPEFQRGPLALYLRTLRQYRNLVRLRFGPRDSYTVFHPDFVKRILVDNNKNYTRAKIGNGLLKAMTGENLLTGDGEFWRRQRRLMQPAFHRQRIFGFGELMTASAADLLTRWDAMPANQIVPIEQEMMRVTLQIVGRSLFSVDLSAGSSQLGHAITVASEYFTYRLSHIFAPPLWVPTRRNQAYKRTQAAGVNQVPDMIAARRRLIAEQGDAETSGRPY